MAFQFMTFEPGLEEVSRTCSREKWCPKSPDICKPKNAHLHSLHCHLQFQPPASVCLYLLISVCLLARLSHLMQMQHRRRKIRVIHNRRHLPTIKLHVEKLLIHLHVYVLAINQSYIYCFDLLESKGQTQPWGRCVRKETAQSFVCNLILTRSIVATLEFAVVIKYLITGWIPCVGNVFPVFAFVFFCFSLCVNS